MNQNLSLISFEINFPHILQYSLFILIFFLFAKQMKFCNCTFLTELHFKSVITFLSVLFRILFLFSYLFLRFK